MTSILGYELAILASECQSGPVLTNAASSSGVKPEE